MLQKYNEKKERLQSRPNDVLPKPYGSQGARLNSAIGNSSGGQPQYLQYLEKTLEKSDQTIQNVKMMGTKL